MLYFTALFAEFLSPYYVNTIHDEYVQVPPQLPRFVDAEGRFHLRPFVYGWEQKRDLETFRVTFERDTSELYPLRLFVRGDSYRWWGLLETDLHLLGADYPGVWFLLATDNTGKDMLSRIFYGARVSLTVGLIGVIFSIILGTLLGKIVEMASADDLYRKPRHPYTEALLKAIPASHPELEHKREPLQGNVPDPSNPPAGCNFHPRCPHATELCAREEPDLQPLDNSGQMAACHHAADLALAGYHEQRHSSPQRHRCRPWSSVHLLRIFTQKVNRGP